MAESGRLILLGEREGVGEAALVEGGRLEDLMVDPPAGDQAPRPGEIYWAKVDRLVAGMGGAFVRLTRQANGWLREVKGTGEGKGVLVQVTAFPEEGKAAPVTRRVLHKGPRLILLPGAPGINLSRRIGNSEERARLVAIVEGLAEGRLESDTGVIIRTGARGAGEAELVREFEALLAEMRAVAAVTAAPPPLDAPAAGRARAVLTALREWAFPGPPRIRAAEPVARALLGAVGEALWGSAVLAEAIEAVAGDPFEEAGVRDAVEALGDPRVALPSGGWMAIEPTSAMVTVDVNTGPSFSAGAALSANLEAARELPRALRLRGLGGQVAIDFAPLKKMHRRQIEEALKAAFRRDPVETTLAGWTPLGHFELQRRRERTPLG